MTLELLKQDKRTNVTWPEQVVLFHVLGEGFFDDLEQDKWSQFEKAFLEVVRYRFPDILEGIGRGGLDEALKKRIQEAVIDSKQEFLS
jgi:F0F1-type ATP synthase alpha subunit